MFSMEPGQRQGKSPTAVKEPVQKGDYISLLFEPFPIDVRFIAATHRDLYVYCQLIVNQ